MTVRRLGEVNGRRGGAASAPPSTMTGDTHPASVPADDTASHSPLADSLHALGGRTWDVLTYSSAYLAVITTVETAIAMFAMSLPLSPAPLVVGLLTFAVYAGDRLADVDADETSRPAQSAFVRRHRGALSVLSAGAYGLAVMVSLLGGPFALAITVLPGAVWLLYATDWLPTVENRLVRLKDVFLLNSALVSGAWAVTLVFLPLAFADAAFTPTAAVVFAYFFVDTFVHTEIPNVRDRVEDARLGVSTLPVVLGVRRTRHVLYGLDLALFALVGYAFLTGLFSLALAAGVFVGLGCALVVIVSSVAPRTTNASRSPARRRASRSPPSRSSSSPSAFDPRSRRRAARRPTARGDPPRPTTLRPSGW